MTIPGPSKTEQILAAIEINLSACYGIDGRVYRDRGDAIGSGEVPCLSLDAIQEEVEPGSTCHERNYLLIRIGIHVAAGPVSTVADPYRVDVHRIMLSDRRAGGLASDVRRHRGRSPAGTKWETDRSDGQRGICDLFYQIEFTTLETDLTA